VGATRNILVVDLNAWDRAHFMPTPARWAKKYNVILHEPDDGCDVTRDPLGFIDRTIDRFKRKPIHGVVSSSDFPGCIVASAIARELRLPAPSPQSVLRCSHKYVSRLAQAEVVPEATPRFALLSTRSEAAAGLRFPLFVKPIKSWYSVLARKVDSAAELKSFLSQPTVKRFERQFLRPFKRLARRYADFEANGGSFIAEEVMHGSQATLEGFVSDGEVETIGIVDSVMYPGTMSFERFEYPSSLPKRVQERMRDLAARVMKHIGYDNGIFNIEMFYDRAQNQVRIIEINPRMAGQFADLMEKVDGTNTYDLLLALASGERPRLDRRKGALKVAASFALRSFRDEMVARVPDEARIARVKRLFPRTGVYVFVREGQRLSEFEHQDDLDSYCYAVMNMGAEDRRSLVKAYRQARQHLEFSFAAD